MTEQNTEHSENSSEAKQQEKTFTQAELDRVVTERLTREREKFKDYDDLKAQVEGAKTAEQKLAEQVAQLQAKQVESEVRATRAVIAAEFGISTKKGDKDSPSDAELLLTGSDEATMRAQAQRVGMLEADRKKHGNVARTEGTTVTTHSDKDAAKREWLRSMTDSD